MSTPTHNTEIITLNNGVKIPKIGLGTWQSEDGQAKHATKIALANGYTHIDTAAIYGNEEEVAEAIKESGIPREKLFITTKVWNNEQNDVAGALDKSLKRLGLDYVDLYLIHWPFPSDDNNKLLTNHTFVDTYKQLQKIYKTTKKARAIGVSNFTIENIEQLLADPEVDVVPAVNQVETHPLLPQPELYDYLKSKNIHIEAYCPLGSTGAPVSKNAAVAKIAEAHKVSPVTVLISWAVQRNTIVLPKSVHEEYIISNAKTIKLSDEEFQAINDITKHEKPQRVNSAPFQDFKDNF